MTAHDRRRLRILAIATLVALGGAVLCVLLIIAFPSFGILTSSSCYICISPQIVLAVLLTPAALALAFATGIRGFRLSRRAGQSGWTEVFRGILLLLLVPTYPICAVCAPLAALWAGGTPGRALTLPMPQDPLSGWVLAGCSVVVVVLTAGCALVYASRDLSPNGPLQG